MNKNVLIVVILLVLAVGGYFLYRYYNGEKTKQDNGKVDSQLSQENLGNEPKLENSENTGLKNFKNDDLGLELSYDMQWEYIDLGGEKNVTEPLVRENVAYFQIANTGDDKTLANVKLLRFVLEDNINITDENDWYDYIKNKIDNFVANEELSSNYQLTDVKIIDKLADKFSVEETYIEDDQYQGKDIYIYNGSEFYQFVTKIRKDLIQDYTNIVDEIVKSIKFN